MAKRNTKVPPHYPVEPRYQGEPPIYGTVVPGEPPGPMLDAVLYWRGQGLLVRCEPTDEPLTLANVQREAADILVNHGANLGVYLSATNAARRPRKVLEKTELRVKVEGAQAERKAAGKAPLSGEQLAAKFKTTRKRVRGAQGKST